MSFFNFFLSLIRLFEGSSPKKIEKLKTLMCYFKSVTEQSRCIFVLFFGQKLYLALVKFLFDMFVTFVCSSEPIGLVTFSRKVLDKSPVWRRFVFRKEN